MNRKRGILFILSVFLLVSIVIVYPKKVIAVSTEDKKIVQANKVWTIRFNDEIEFDETSKQDIAIIDSTGKKVDVEMKAGEDDKSIIISPPTGGYIENSTYILTLGTKVHGKFNRKLKNSVIINFSIGNENNIPEEIYLIDESIASTTQLSKAVVTVNGKDQTFTDPKPYTKDGKTIIPMKVVTDALGCTVTFDKVAWAKGEQILNVSRKNNVLSFDLKNKKTKLNGVEVKNTATSFVSLSMIVKAFGGTLTWKEQGTDIVVEITIDGWKSPTGASTGDSTEGSTSDNNASYQSPRIKGNATTNPSATDADRVFDLGAIAEAFGKRAYGSSTSGIVDISIFDKYESFPGGQLMIVVEEDKPYTMIQIKMWKSYTGGSKELDRIPQDLDTILAFYMPTQHKTLTDKISWAYQPGTDGNSILNKVYTYDNRAVKVVPGYHCIEVHISNVGAKTVQ